MEKVNMSELLEEVADEVNISFEDARDIMKNTFFSHSAQTSSKQ